MNNNTVVKKVVDYIETHINEDLSLDKIANALSYSKFYIARIFTEETYKCTPNIYRKNGVFYPKQTKICMMSSVNGYPFMYYLAGGKLTA